MLAKHLPCEEDNERISTKNPILEEIPCWFLRDSGFALRLKPATSIQWQPYTIEVQMKLLCKEYFYIWNKIYNSTCRTTQLLSPNHIVHTSTISLWSLSSSKLFLFIFIPFFIRRFASLMRPLTNSHRIDSSSNLENYVRFVNKILTKNIINAKQYHSNKNALLLKVQFSFLLTAHPPTPTPPSNPTSHQTANGKG